MKALLNWLAPAELRMSDFVIVTVVAVIVGTGVALLGRRGGVR